MTGSIIKKTVLISLLGHMTFFGIFSFSFGQRITKADYSNLVFWGQLLENAQLRPLASQDKIPDPLRFTKKIEGLQNRFHFPARKAGIPAPEGGWQKPQQALMTGTQKLIPAAEESAALPPPFKKRELTIMFHPLLPYGFRLYFRDRQVAHVELAFRALSGERGNSITVKRKISSGNLEVDLLSTRYIERYLSMQSKNFTSTEWQTVKIDLSAEDQ